VTHTTFQELLLTPFNVHEILGFEILSSEKRFCQWEIFEILFHVRGLDPCPVTPDRGGIARVPRLQLCCGMLPCVAVCWDLRCDINHEPVYGIRHIGERIIRGCASAVLRNCNMIELVYSKLTHTYAATRRPCLCTWAVLLWVFQFFQICLSLLKKGRVLDSPENM